MSKRPKTKPIVHFTLDKYYDADEYISSGRLPRKENNGDLPGWGYRLGMDDDEAFALNRWDWTLLPERAPKFVLFSWSGIVRFAAEVTEIVRIPGSPRKLKRIEGRVLRPNHPVYIQYVNQSTPDWVKGHNPHYPPDE